MEVVDPDAPNPKRPRLDSVNPVYNGLPPPPQPPQAQPVRHPSSLPHPSPTQASSPPPNRGYPPHSLPPPAQAYPSSGPSHFGPSQPSPSLPPTDIRNLSDPRNIPSPGHRTHGLPSTPVTLPARNIPQDSISTYRAPGASQPASAPEFQSSRSNSISDAKPQPPQGMEHGGAPGSWAVTPDPRHAVGIANGYSQSISPPNPGEQPYGAPPVPPGQHYGQPTGPYGPGPYMSQYGTGPGQQIRRKQVRATQACNHCRSRKQKCDEARPCQFCRENNFECQYKDVPPPKQDRSMMQLQESVNNIGNDLKRFIDSFNLWKQHVEDRLPSIKGGESMSMVSDQPSPEHTFGARGSISEHHASRMPTPVQGRMQLNRVNSMKMESPVVPHSHVSPAPAHTSTPIKQEPVLAAPQPPATPAESVRTDHTQQATDATKERTGLQSDHTTSAHQLLEEWSTMKEFCVGLPEFKRLRDLGHNISEYPMLFEQDRGLLRVWGVGEGHDSNDGAQGPGSPESSNGSDAPSPASMKEGIWGYPPVDHSSPSTVSGDTPGHYNHPGGLGPDGKPDFRSSTLRQLHESYHKHIHNLHPFLNPKKLRGMIRDFGAVYSPDARAANAMSPGISERLNPGIKRKRSSSMFGDGYGLADDLSKGTIERSMRNAIVLLVLALGKVCQYKMPLPAPQADRSPLTNGAWGFTRDSPHSTSNSFSSDGGDSRLRNIDLLPGMAYFSYATDILGNQQGGNTVAHAQAMLLAALYLGQYARVLESWSWINNACRVCLVLIKADLNKISREAFHQGGISTESPAEHYRLNLVKCVYWTCLQLETDILAELSTLPPTAISEYQNEIMYPSGVHESFPGAFPDDTEDSESNMTMWIYSSQIHLRVILNGAHNTLYRAADRKSAQGFDSTNLREVAHAARVHAEVLKSWRKLLPPPLAWDDNESPSTDINIARMRAKFYGGLYMILRPYLYMAVHQIGLPPTMSSHTSSPAAIAESSGPSGHPIYRNMVDLNSDQSDVLEIAHECIQSAIQSTIAFDRVGAEPESEYRDYKATRKDRLILPNVFGTLHAQFGNMIVLAAVYRSQLRKYLPPDSPLNIKNLAALFSRTMTVLEEIAPNSPILATDWRILQNVKRLLQLD